MAKIIQEECVGCGVCANICPEGIEMINGKAKIKNENADCLKEAADACPRNVILLDGEGSGDKESKNNPMGFGQGRGMGAGKGRGLGLGPRNGRGMGRGGGGRGKRW
jgi:ferredoxin